jgi:WD40 repeat protein
VGATTGEGLRTLLGLTSIVLGVAFSPDGKRLATASLDGTGKVWDATSGEELLTLNRHTNTVCRITFSLDGKGLATASWDRTARVWDASSGEELLTLSHTHEVQSIAFSPNGRRLATASADRAVRVYVLNIEDLMVLARTHVTRSLTPEECRKYLYVEQCPPAP